MGRYARGHRTGLCKLTRREYTASGPRAFHSGEETARAARAAARHNMRGTPVTARCYRVRLKRPTGLPSDPSHAHSMAAAADTMSDRKTPQAAMRAWPAETYTPPFRAPRVPPNALPSAQKSSLAPSSDAARISVTPRPQTRRPLIRAAPLPRTAEVRPVTQPPMKKAIRTRIPVTQAFTPVDAYPGPMPYARNSRMRSEGRVVIKAGPDRSPAHAVTYANGLRGHRRRVGNVGRARYVAASVRVAVTRPGRTLRYAGIAIALRR